MAFLPEALARAFPNASFVSFIKAFMQIFLSIITVLKHVVCGRVVVLVARRTPRNSFCQITQQSSQLSVNYLYFSMEQADVKSANHLLIFHFILGFCFNVSHWTQTNMRNVYLAYSVIALEEFWVQYCIRIGIGHAEFQHFVIFSVMLWLFYDHWIGSLASLACLYSETSLHPYYSWPHLL